MRTSEKTCSMRAVVASGLALSLVACNHLATSHHSRKERNEQQTAIEAIHLLGGQVRYDYQRPRPDIPNLFDMERQPENPEAFHRVVLVDLADTKATDDHLEHLKKLPYLENLNLSNTNITGAGLTHLRGLNNLRVLSLWKTQVDDTGLENLEGLTKLWQLILDETNVTDAGLAHLEGLTDLEEWLGLFDTKITDQGLKHLTGLTELRSLNLRRTQVTEAGIRELRAALSDTDISFGP